MGKTDIEVDPEHEEEKHEEEKHEEEKHEEEQSPSIYNEGDEVESSEVEGKEKEKTLDELKEENKDLSDKMMRALAETENIRKKFFKEKQFQFLVVVIAH